MATTVRATATPAMHSEGLANWALTMGRQRLGALTLQNHPPVPAEPAACRASPRRTRASSTSRRSTSIRDRERGIPRFNEFRRQYGLRSLTGFDDFVDVRLPQD